MVASVEQRDRRRMLIAQAGNLLAKGMSDRQVAAFLQGDPYRTSRSTAYRCVRGSHSEHRRRLMKDRPRLIAQQNAKLDEAQRVAMAGLRHFVNWYAGEPKVHTEPSPDLGAFISAVTAQNKLLGVNAPERHEIIVATVNATMMDMVSLVMRHLPEEKRGNFMADLDELIERRRLDATMHANQPGVPSPPSPPQPPQLGDGAPT